MTKTTAEKIAVMQAYERGEKIEAKSNGVSTRWSVNYDPRWNWSSFDYRIAAPEPVPHTIDWSHVSEDFVCILTSSCGDVLLSDKHPNSKNPMTNWGFPVGFRASRADHFKSFKPGNMPWQESLVVRPVDAKK